jgi:hypothetical protein
MTLEEIKHGVHTLTLEQRKQLIAFIVDSLAEEPTDAEKTHSILEFEGIAAHLADSEDPQQYVNRLRSEWDDRP